MRARPQSNHALATALAPVLLGRIWEIRQGIKRQTVSQSARLPSTRSDRHGAVADRVATPRGLWNFRLRGGLQRTSPLMRVLPINRPTTSLVHGLVSSVPSSKSAALGVDR